MAQHVILGHPAIAKAAPADKPRTGDWHPRTKLACFVGCALGSWVLVIAPFLLIG